MSFPPVSSPPAAAGSLTVNDDAIEIFTGEILRSSIPKKNQPLSFNKKGELLTREITL